jgi:hypothetical protein
MLFSLRQDADVDVVLDCMESWREASWGTACSEAKPSLSGRATSLEVVAPSSKWLASMGIREGDGEIVYGNVSDRLYVLMRLTFGDGGGTSACG